MRPPTAQEVVLLARVLTRLAPADRRRAARAILRDTDVAESHWRATGLGHSTFGDGSLMSRCHLLFPPAEPMADCRDFLACLSTAALCVRAHSEI